MTDVNTKGLGSNLLTWAMIAGAALLFLEVTLSSVQPAPARTTAVQTVTVAAHPDRLARN
jgi:hypothetical protein